MESVLVLLLVLAVAAIIGLLLVRRPVAAVPAAIPVVPPATQPLQVPAELVQQAVAAAVAQANDRAAHERDMAVQAAVQQALLFTKEQLGMATQAVDASLQGRHQLIDQQLGEVKSVVHDDLQRLSAMVQQLGEQTAQKFGDVDRSLQAQAEVTQALHGTAASLRDALANTNARGQWGERMAEDVLRLAGLLPNVNYLKRTAVAGEGRAIPDFTFLMPDQHVMFMDVKFPVDSYLSYLQATTEAEKSAHRDAFLRAVRGHMKELSRRDYASVDDRPAVDNVLMFVPNETIVGFIHEHSPSLIDEAMREHVVLCSPLTLFAFLGVIRQAFENFRLEQTSREMLSLLGRFSVQWKKYNEQVDKVKKQFDTVAGSFDDLAGARRRQLERPLRDLEALRQERHVAIEGELFALETDDDRTVRQLGA
ncbi:MAG: DNA recombination protein RmuC [Actinobacteria bacterium]|nr:DNA recombination protein RmuC [Actinomycetota bacterium]